MLKFKRSDFFPLKGTLNIITIESILHEQIINSSIKDRSILIEDISSLNEIRKNSIIFLNSDNHDKKIKSKNILVISNKKNTNSSIHENIIFVKDIDISYNLISNQLFLHEDNISYEDKFECKNGAYISVNAKVHPSSKIGNNSLIGRGVQIGKNTIVKNNTVIKNAIIGDNVIICDNSTVGSTGFGFNFSTRGSSNLNPQIGIVYIGNSCHIGSSCTIDRAKIDVTYIGNNCMIDNLVHIAHNVQLSENACIAAQTGISGSVTIGKNVTIGGQVGFAGHIKIGDNVVIAAKSGVTKNIKDNSIIAGFPAIEMKEWKKKIIRERKNGYK